MNKRVIIGIVVLLFAVVAVYMLLAPATVDPGEHRLAPSTSAPGQEGALATGGALATDASGIHGITPSATAVAPGFDGGDKEWDRDGGARPD